MPKRMSIEGERRLDLTLTVGVDGEHEAPAGWPWETIIGGGFTLVVAAAFFLAAVGTPYLLDNTSSCAGIGTEGHPCAPPVNCDYRGLQGHRSVVFWDVDRCPLITILPRLVNPEPLPDHPAGVEARRRP